MGWGRRRVAADQKGNAPAAKGTARVLKETADLKGTGLAKEIGHVRMASGLAARGIAPAPMGTVRVPTLIGREVKGTGHVRTGSARVAKGSAPAAKGIARVPKGSVLVAKGIGLVLKENGHDAMNNRDAG